MATQIKKNKPENNDNVLENLDTQENIENAEQTNNEVEELKKQLEAKNAEISNMSAMFATMQAQLNMLMNNQSKPSTDKSEDVLIGCRAVYGAVLATNDNKYVFKFECDEEKYIDSEDLKTVLKESGRDNKKLFEQDTFYFVNEEDYEKFKIKKRVDLSRENLIRILTKNDSYAMIDEINKMTNNLLNYSVTHAIQYEIVKMLIDTSNPLKDWKYENRTALERYINQKFDDLMASIGALELLGRKKFR